MAKEDCDVVHQESTEYVRPAAQPQTECVRREREREKERKKERKKERQRETEGERKGARQIIGRQEAAVPEVAATAEAQIVCLS